MACIGTRVARLGHGVEDDDWWTLCGQIVEAIDVVQSPESTDCVECLALYDDDDA